MQRPIVGCRDYVPLGGRECDGVADVHEKGEINHLNGLEPRGRLKAFGVLTFSSREMRNCSWYQSPKQQELFSSIRPACCRVKFDFSTGAEYARGRI